MPNIPRLTPATVALIVLAILIALRLAGVTGGPETRASRQERTVRIRHVLDGDTVETADGTRVRLLGIDAPEVAHHDQPGEQFGPESAAWLHQLVNNRVVTLRIGDPSTDIYGRTLAWIILPNGRNVSELSLATGHARLLDRFGLPEEYEDSLRRAAAEARVRRVGLWQPKKL
ncbi:MAG: thermonuclease family protein [Planctomycetaceae bacterium]|nr:thermonuclease family protein [Planctomycetaceae bacterium]